MCLIQFWRVQSKYFCKNIYHRISAHYFVYRHIIFTAYIRSVLQSVITSWYYLYFRLKHLSQQLFHCCVLLQMSHLFNMFSKQVTEHCDTSTMPGSWLFHSETTNNNSLLVLTSVVLFFLRNARLWLLTSKSMRRH